MKTLYESILGDMEDSIGRMEADIIDIVINDSNSKLWQTFDFNRQDVGRKYPLKYSDNTLYVPRLLVQNYRPAKSLASLTKLIGSTVDHFVCGGSLHIANDAHLFSPNNFCKKITCAGGLTIASKHIKDLELSVGRLDDIGIKKFPVGSCDTCFTGAEMLENIIWESDVLNGIKFIVDEVPTIKNCEFKGVNTITLYSPNIFDNTKVTNSIQSKWMLPNYDYEYFDKSNLRQTVAIKNFKKLCSVINQNKKYSGGVIKCFKDHIKASDVIPWINTIPGLKYVILKNDNVKISLWKTNPVACMSIVTDDGWSIVLEKNKF